MISSRLTDTEPTLNLKDLFYEKNNRANLNLLQEIQTVLQRCTHLTEKQRLMYCESQRYFMKQYLREMNRQL